MSSLAVATLADAGRDRVSVYLQPGQIHVADAPTTITTILASCIAVCLFDAGRGIGGMNHFLLPHALGTDGTPARFGASAIHLLIEQILAKGSRMRDLQAKVFGGATVIGAVAANRNRMLLGDSNARCAFELLAQAHIPIVASDVGGTRGRKIIFHTEDGSAFMKWL
ncbi:MAG: chemotaxis protein CheD [Thermoanaerobaculia bacterium]